MFAMIAARFANLRIKSKIIFGFVCVLTILAMVSLMGFLAFGTVAESSQTYAQRVAVVGIARDIDREFLALRRHVREFAHTGHEDETKAAADVVRLIRTKIDEGLATIKNPERRKKIDEIREKFAEYIKGFDRVVELKREQGKLISETLDPVGLQSGRDFDKLKAEAAKSGNSNAAILANTAAEEMLQVRLSANKVLGRHDDAAAEKADSYLAELAKALDGLDAATRGASFRSVFDEIKTLADRYSASYHQASKVGHELETLVNDTMVKAGAAISEDAKTVKDSGIADEQAVEKSMHELIGWTKDLILILALGGLALGLAIAWFLGGAIARPISEAASAMGRLAQGDDSIAVTVADRRDEVGMMQKALAELRTAVAAAFRTGQMVENMPTNVMTCTLPNLEVAYMNAGTKALLRKLEAQGLLPCKVDEMVGRSIDMFHKNPAHQRRILADPSNLPHRAQIKVGPETLALNISAVRDRAGAYVGPMLVWNVVTAQVTLADEVNQVVDSVASGTTQLEASAQAMSSTAEQTNSQAAAVAAASEQTSANVQTVSTAAEELSSSIREIGRQVTNAAKTASEAVSQANRTNSTVQGLADAAQKIGAVVELINGIASQTNLLALNATIEAARAGDAGKGFAVVASEVKSLANQTAKATEEIASQITAMQSVTQEAVDAIREIGVAVSGISEIATTIASAVEEQEAATQEIARNVQQAAAGTQEVSSNIVGVTQAANQTGAAAGQVLSVSGELSRQAQALRAKIEKFIADSKAA